LFGCSVQGSSDKLCYHTGETMPKTSIRIIALSGKRFTGKDTFADALLAEAASLGVTIPKGAFATECKRAFIEAERSQGRELDLERLLGERAYKEQHRPALTAFTERSLAQDPLVFVRRVLTCFEPFGCGLISDLRLRVELDFLRQHTDLLAVRLERAAPHRAESGWRFTPGTDDHWTETELDAEQGWGLVLHNDGSREAWMGQAEALARRVHQERLAAAR
jgi:phosphomevalonate kinase